MLCPARPPSARVTRSNGARHLLVAALSSLAVFATGCESIEIGPDGPDAPDDAALGDDAGAPLQPAPDGFFGYYTRIRSNEAWEENAFVGAYPDIVVQVSATEQVSFWRGASFRPIWRAAGRATSVEQLFETAGDGDGVRWDRLNRHAHARIISQSPEEIVVHWRYAPVFETTPAPMVPGWTGWVDEYYTIRPDRTMTRTVLSHDADARITFEITLGADGTLAEAETARSTIEQAEPATRPSTRLPTGPDLGFGATYTRLGYAGAWDTGPDDGYAPSSGDWSENWQVGDHPDVVVNFDDNATRWVFWRGLGFVPSMVSDNDAWFSNEFNESWGWPEMCEEGGAEPMNDKQARYSHVRIIENTPARVVVQWRYHPTGICYTLIDTDGTPDGWGATSEFVFYIYPDGSSLSQNTLFSQQVNSWGEGPNGFEYHEAMVMHGPGTMPSDNIEVHDTVTVMNLDGGSWVFDGAEGGIDGDSEEPFVDDAPVNIARINLRDTAYDTYTIMPEGPQNIIAPYWDDDFENSTPDGHFVSWDHWPVNQIRAFGRGSRANRYPSHSSLFHMYDGPASGMGDTWQQRLFLTGLTDRDDAFVAALGRSWLRPPAIQPARGITAARYDAAERAYALTADGDRLAFSLAGSPDTPIINPAFVIRGWGGTEPAELRVDGRAVPGASQGIARDADGAPMLVLFVPVEVDAEARFDVVRAEAR